MPAPTKPIKVDSMDLSTLAIPLWMLLGILYVLAASSCGYGGSDNNDPQEITPGLYLRIDSVHHVACYNRRGAFQLSCVPLDSTNTFARGK